MLIPTCGTKPSRHISDKLIPILAWRVDADPDMRYQAIPTYLR
jgi:hypothetical protein